MRKVTLGCALVLVALGSGGCRSLQPKESDSTLTSIGKVALLLPLAVAEVVFLDEEADWDDDDAWRDDDCPNEDRHESRDRPRHRRKPPGAPEPMPPGAESAY